MDSTIPYIIGMLALLAAVASGLAILRLRRGERAEGATKGQHALVWICTLGSAAVFIQQVFAHGWNPITSHVDGLILVATLLGVTMLYLQHRPRLEELGAFALPVLTLVLAWALCPDSQELWHFNKDEAPSAWRMLHLGFVYVGMLASVVAACAGAMYLYVERRLHQKRDLGELGRFASLEKLETIIIRQATIGFVLLSLGLITGLVISTSNKADLVAGWWHSPKILLATAAWVVYAVLMNLRSATAFRGARAAWLSIAGLVILLATYGVVTALPGPLAAHASNVSTTHQEGR
jgi:ABC-type uncharacterized transport system permease subunit